jgi:hypothetical protein
MKAMADRAIVRNLQLVPLPGTAWSVNWLTVAAMNVRRRAETAFRASLLV